jgi:hypothetical protein
MRIFYMYALIMTQQQQINNAYMHLYYAIFLRYSAKYPRMDLADIKAIYDCLDVIRNK